MVTAAEASLLVATEVQASTPVRARFREGANVAIGVLEHDQILTQKAHPLGGRVWRWEF